ncbi:hypothetical protein ACFO0J_07055 [Castellaniella hirudinis]|uniref:Uncharacterized protein n=1 Tax=Castellaniella hirudinis TaxID=1144617 RepID=A0ABV8RXD0_9BURK
MPGIQNLGQPGIQNLQRQHLNAGPLGQVGNLRFKAESGATPRASAPNVFQRFGQFMSKLAFYVGASPTQRAQQFVLDQARDNSRRVGNLLGNLTASPNDPKARSKIAEGLARLGDLSGGDLSNLPGGKESLKTYLSELGFKDLGALRSGVLGNPEARQAVIDQVDPPRLRAQAGQLLDQIAAALDQALAGQAVQEPLEQVRTLLAGKPVDGQALDTQLTRLSENLAMLGGDKLDTYLQTLSDADLKALQAVLNPDKLGAAKASLTQIRNPDVQPLSLEEAPDLRHETYDPQLIQSGRIQQGETLLDRISGALDKEIQGRIDQALPDLLSGLETAVQSGDRAAIAKALFSLNQQVDHLNLTYGALPVDTARAVREQVVLAMDALRDPETNPDGPLTRDSLKRLDDDTLGLLRRSGGALSAFGLKLNREDARAEGLSRVEALSRQVVEGMSDILTTLSSETPDMPALMRQLRDLSELELQRGQQLARLGHYGDMASVDDRKDMVVQAFQQALDSLGDERDEVSARARQHLGLLIGMEDQFHGASSGLSQIMDGGDFARGGTEALKRLGTTQHMLGGIITALHGTITDEAESEKRIPSIDPPGSFLTSLVEQYGVRFDPETYESTLVLTDGAGAKLAPHLEEPIDPTLHPTRKVTLPVRGTDTEFSVGSSFFKDGIERTSLSLSVRGVDVEGGMVRSTWPRSVPEGRRDEIMGEALDALVKIAGPAAEPLTRLMNQQLGAGILKGLQDMGVDSPFKLEDGSVVMPVGAGRFHFDIEKTEDGGFRVGATMTIPIQDAVGLDKDGVGFPVAMDPAASWAQVRVTLDVSSDGLQFRMSEPPQFQHHFVLTEPRHD